MSRARSAAHHCALAGYFGLLMLLMLWPTILSPPQYFPVALVLTLSVLPLLLPLRGLLQGRPKALIWTAYLSLAYFIHGITEAGSGSTDQTLATLEILISLLLFFGCTGYIKSLNSL